MLFRSPPVIPEGVNVPPATVGAATAEVGAQTISGPSALDTQPDARKPAGTTAPATSNPQAPGTAAPEAKPNPETPAGAEAASSNGGGGNGSAGSQTESSSKKKKKGRFLKVIPRP